MKISGLLLEKANYDAQLMGDINAYLISLKANDIPSVPMDMMVRELEGMGIFFECRVDGRFII